MQLFQLKHASCTAGKLAIATYTFNEKSPNPMKRTRQSLYTILCTQYHFGYNGLYVLYNVLCKEQWLGIDSASIFNRNIIIFDIQRAAIRPHSAIQGRCR
jgi:hypothetical protein